MDAKIKKGNKIRRSRFQMYLFNLKQVQESKQINYMNRKLKFYQKVSFLGIKQVNIYRKKQKNVKKASYTVVLKQSIH